ncbi:MAG TPA: protease inhibitor I42 family protein [Dehalococcoidia bacterium]|nr:protease inhibitor I42 family protein [Dehalococcoidia bacterium]
MPETTLTAADNGRAIEVESADELVVELDENATTGYRWAVEEPLPAGLSLSSSDYEPGGATPGAGGKRRIRLHATGAGGGALSLKLWREWQGDASVTERFRVTVTIGA